MPQTYPSKLVGGVQMARELLRLRVRSLEKKQKRAEANEGADSRRAKVLRARLERERAKLARVGERFARAEERLRAAEETLSTEATPEAIQGAERLRTIVTKAAERVRSARAERRAEAEAKPAKSKPPKGKKKEQ